MTRKDTIEKVIIESLEKLGFNKSSVGSSVSIYPEDIGLLAKNIDDALTRYSLKEWEKQWTKENEWEVTFNFSGVLDEERNNK